jgi:hypothetical protein
LYRLKFFVFARIKREDLFEVVVFTQQRVPQRPKQNKNTRFIPKGRYNQRGKFFASFLLAQERWSQRL